MMLKWIKAAMAASAVLLIAPVVANADTETPYERQYQKPSYYKGGSKPLPYKGNYRSVVSHYNWTGPYAGIHLGWGWGSSTWDSPAVTNKPTGMQFGTTLGYNWQIGSFVYGVEGDIGWSGLKSSTSCGLFTCESRNQFLGTLRGRAGYAFDRLMPYMTAGLAVGDIKAATNNPAFPGASGTKLGWTIGAGVEYAIMTKWTMKVEYLYTNLGSIDCGNGCGPLTPNKVSLTANALRLGLNYKFGGGPNFDKW
jgi:outer membrane immunogenic protein